ncbi:phospholipase D-like domain-containing protein [Akkermansiaceae bacterium]|nr:phospholipase D-like domain-containing protein [bacterium]MDB2428652.1 phospholipase D-like domain-containing protein [Akkermansiaceae bacterium]MDB4745152.1 phospholipase D-like domain-containing protein [bacterium]MDB4759333.1 phospholipase D-like domain-containing protein [Akkermansiaceae bacterium]
MDELESFFRESLEDFALSRSEKKNLKVHLAKIGSDKVGQAKARQLAFRLANNAIDEFGQIAALDWLQGVIKLLYARENEVKASAYFSPGEDCLHRIRRLIGEARESLDICIFTITDNRIVKKLEEAHARKIRIRIISDDDKSEDLGSDLDHLRRAGISCRFDRTTAHMHHKFAVADNDLLLTGSYNWTRSAATENDENIIVTNNRKLVNSFQLKFDELWERLG